jgi:PKD repeat protein
MFFTDNSTVPFPDSIVGWNWNFGDTASGPNNFSSLQNPWHIYADNGTYFVTLVDTSGAGCYNDTTIMVSVNPDPIPLFNYPSVVCSGDTLQFTNTTDSVGYTVTSWQWNFGDPGSGANNVSSQIHPSHYYNAAGNYSVTLTVTLNSGCSATHTAIVQVAQAVIPFFTFQNTCIGQVTNFNTSVSANLLWNFGDNSFLRYRLRHTSLLL